MAPGCSHAASGRLASAGARLRGRGAIWWWVEAVGEREALGLLPFFVAQRATATRIGTVEIP
jgi:hypothetical protein